MRGSEKGLEVGDATPLGMDTKRLPKPLSITTLWQQIKTGSEEHAAAGQSDLTLASHMACRPATSKSCWASTASRSVMSPGDALPQAESATARALPTGGDE